MEDIKEVGVKLLGWLVSVVVLLLSWIFNKGQAEQDRRITVVENKVDEVVKSVSKEIKDADTRDEARHIADRSEVKADLREIRDRSERQHIELVKRLDTIINGNGKR